MNARPRPPASRLKAARPPRRTCFVLMPFAAEFDLVYDAILRAARQCNIDCWRSDKKKDLGLITEALIVDILTADLLVADVTGYNPNVLYELGIAHTLGKPTIILSQELRVAGGRLPFDISNMTAVPYRHPDRPGDTHQAKLGAALVRFLCADRFHMNPVNATIEARGLRLANHYGHRFLWGFARTLEESRRARVAWVISTKLYWERSDPTFHRRIVGERIRRGQRRELVLMPDTPENRFRVARRRGAAYDALRVLLVNDPRLFAFLSTEVSLYDPGTPQARGIVLEPMAHEGVDDQNDHLIAHALRSRSAPRLLLQNLRESTFDIALPKPAVENLAASFRAIWNEECERQSLHRWLIP